MSAKGSERRVAFAVENKLEEKREGKAKTIFSASGPDAEYQAAAIAFDNELIRHFIPEQSTLYYSGARTSVESIEYKIMALDNEKQTTLEDVKPIEFYKQFRTGKILYLAELMVYFCFLNDRNVTLKDIGIIKKEGKWCLTKRFHSPTIFSDFPAESPPDFAKIFNFLPFVDGATNWFGLFHDGKVISSSLLRDDNFTNLFHINATPQFKQGVCRAVYNLLSMPTEVIEKNILDTQFINEKVRARLLKRHKDRIQHLIKSFRSADPNENYIKHQRSEFDSPDEKPSDRYLDSLPIAEIEKLFSQKKGDDELNTIREALKLNDISRNLLLEAYRAVLRRREEEEPAKKHEDKESKREIKADKPEDLPGAVPDDKNKGLASYLFSPVSGSPVYQAQPANNSVSETDVQNPATPNPVLSQLQVATLASSAAGSVDSGEGNTLSASSSPCCLIM